jgi:hypothetical protein
VRQQARKYQAPIGGVGWAHQVVSRPDQYDGLMRQLAVRALHHHDGHHSRPELQQECGICMAEQRRATV